MSLDHAAVKNCTARDALLGVMIDNRGTDLYYTVGTFPAIKIAGEIVSINEGIGRVTAQETENMAKSLLSEEQLVSLHRDQNLDFAFEFLGSRFRGNVSFQQGYYMVVVRLLSTKVPTLEELNLPPIYSDVSRLGQGLILITGPTGSGKTTTLAAMIDYINTNFTKHIITIEDPVEYIHEHKKSIIEHKQIGWDVPDYKTALIGAMRQNPQVILFGEMRSTAEIEAALTLAETGHLVMSTLHTKSASQTISRIIDSFESGHQNQVRIQLAETLIAVFSQRLFKKSDGSGVKMAREVLVKNNAVANLIRENQLHQVPSIMQTAVLEGMQVIEKDIIHFINNGDISLEEGLKYANNPKYVRDNVNI